jgi:hypothetical protein
MLDPQNIEKINILFDFLKTEKYLKTTIQYIMKNKL